MMSISNNRAGIVAAAATLLVSSPASHASTPAPCSNASLRGDYAFQIDGTNANGPFAAVGKSTYDGRGGVTGVFFMSSNGAIIPAHYTGTYALRADCTAVKSANLDIGITVNFYFVVDSNLREIRMISTDAGSTVTGTARKLFSGDGPDRR